jgi:hypothetical protein
MPRVRFAADELCEVSVTTYTRADLLSNFDRIKKSPLFANSHLPLALLEILIEAPNNTISAKEILKTNLSTSKDSIKQVKASLRYKLMLYNNTEGTIDSYHFEINKGRNYILIISPNVPRIASNIVSEEWSVSKPPVSANYPAPHNGAQLEGARKTAGHFNRLSLYLYVRFGLISVALISLFATLYLTWDVKIIRPLEGDIIYVRNYERAAPTVLGTGGSFLFNHYLIVHHVGGDAYIQECREFHPNYLNGLKWNCPIYIGDINTPTGSQFKIYVLNTWFALRGGVDFNLNTGRLNNEISRSPSSNVVTVTMSREGR